MKKIMTMLGLCASINLCCIEVNAQKNGKNGHNQQQVSSQDVPKKVMSSYEADYPGSGNVQWSGKSTYWYVRCDDNRGYHCLTAYLQNGRKHFTARDLLAGEVPGAVQLYCQRNGETLSPNYPIVQVEVPGQLNNFQIVTASGRTVYLDENGVEATNTIDGFDTY
jgi:hypothetical protein